MSKKKFTGNFGAKGYYIALILCAVAIGISGYMYYHNTKDADPADQPSLSADGQQDTDLPVVATQPDQEETPSQTTTTEKDHTGEKKPGKITSPVSGQTVSDYAMDALSYNQTTRDWRTHNGIDIAAEAGTQVCSAADGTVYTVYEDDTMGMTVVIRHDGGYLTTYSSLDSQISVKPGDAVEAGQAIGCVGNSALMESAIGDHVHFSVTLNGAHMDPEQFLASGEE